MKPVMVYVETALIATLLVPAVVAYIIGDEFVRYSR